MKATGIVRKVDNLGRIVLPIELRKAFGIDIKDPVEIFTEGEYVMLKKYLPVCVLCGEETSTIEFKGKKVCSKCLKEIKAL
jgi:transcriptional pleiotropic regulator of transition state genes